MTGSHYKHPTDFAHNLAQVNQRIATACAQSGRNPEVITLIAVSKTKPWSAVATAYRAGQRHFGENYLQDALTKIAQVQDMAIAWHFIGAIQANKTRTIATHFSWVHTLDRIKIAQRLNDQRPKHLPPLHVFIQVNVNHEENKAGIELEQLPGLVAKVQQLPRLRLQGLMCIPRPTQDQQTQAMPFQQLQQALVKLQADYPDLQQLSMGMSADLEAAIAAGATHIRVGTDLFGARN
jgi:pyridoxal phosphate enzyme (YggS family)